MANVKEIEARDEYDFLAAQYTKGDTIKAKVMQNGEEKAMGETELAAALREANGGRFLPGH